MANINHAILDQYGNRQLVALGLRRNLLEFNDIYPLAEICAQQCPGTFPAIALDQAAQCEDGLATVLTPRHPRLFHALCGKCFAGCLDDTTGDGQAFPQISSVLHTMPLVAEVGQLFLNLLPTTTPCSAEVILETADDDFHSVVFLLEQRSIALELCLALDRIVVPDGIAKPF